MVAAARAVETGLADGFARDPFAARLAGERGMAIYNALPHRELLCFGMGLRTRFLDELLMEALAAAKIATVVCAGAGLDTRPWRLDLPPQLRWIEVDFPAMLDYKDALMAAETPRCRRERVTADLNQAGERRALFAAVGEAPALLITEGLLMYLPAATVDALAAESAHETGIAQWISDITTAAFSKALDGGRPDPLNHVRAGDALDGDRILEVAARHGWTTSARRSYLTDLGFAAARAARMMANRPPDAPRPSFPPGDVTGVHRLARAA